MCDTSKTSPVWRLSPGKNSCRPAYEWMVRIGAPLIMHTDPELGLYGRYCISRRLKEEAFDFNFPDVTSALQNLYCAT